MAKARKAPKAWKLDPQWDELRRIRWFVRSCVALGVGWGLTVNVLHAPHDLISQSIAGWPPLALLLTVELMTRVPGDSKLFTAIRMISTSVVALGAAWMNYWHMAAMAGSHGEQGVNSYVWPLTVDGLLVVGSLGLVTLGRKMRKIQDRYGYQPVAVETNGTQSAVAVPVQIPAPAVVAPVFLAPSPEPEPEVPGGRPAWLPEPAEHRKALRISRRTGMGVLEPAATSEEQ